MTTDISNVTIVDAPQVFLAEDEMAGELLLHFYRELGWNGVDILDPCKVRTTREVCNRLYDIMYERYPNAVSVGMFMVNRGPGVDEYIPQGKVHLLDGWIMPAETDEIEGEM